MERVGRSSATLAQALFVGERCVATSESIVALMEMTKRRSIVLPREASEALRTITRPENGSGTPAAVAPALLSR